MTLPTRFLVVSAISLQRAALLSLVPLVLACGPVGPVPGGRLSGPVAEHPIRDWSFTAPIKTVQLETLPDAPYSVNVWGVASGSSFYVASGEGAASRWARNIETDPRVRLKAGDEIVELKATHVADASEIDAVLVRLKAKYDFEPTPEQRAKAWLFRLDPR
jgi:hypothetical protein